MVNPAMVMKLMSAKNTFVANHPRFSAFLGDTLKRGVSEGTIIELTVTRPDEAPVTTNIRVTQSDLELFEQLKAMGRQ